MKPFDPHDSATWPITLTVDQMGAIYQRPVGGIRKSIQHRRFQPLPFLVHPYRWRRDDVKAHVERQTPASQLRRIS